MIVFAFAALAATSNLVVAAAAAAAAAAVVVGHVSCALAQAPSAVCFSPKPCSRDFVCGCDVDVLGSEVLPREIWWKNLAPSFEQKINRKGKTVSKNLLGFCVPRPTQRNSHAVDSLLR